MATTPSVLRSSEPRSKARPPKFREASFRDHAQIAALESRYGLTAKSYEAWTHLWLGNPLYRELRPGWKIGWVLEDETRQIVGTMGNIPLLYEFQGKKLLVATGRSWVAEPASRSASLVLLDSVVNQRGVDLYVNNTVGVESAAAVETFECLRVPVGRWDEWAYWIADYRSFMETYLVQKSWRLAKLLSSPFSTVVALRDRLTKNSLRDSDVEVTQCFAFDDRFDDFWDDMKRRNPHLLLAVRTRELLEWHYKYALADGELWIATVVDGSRLAAYATFQRKDKLGLKRVRLVDFQSLDGSTALLAPLLSWALRKCRDEGIHMLENFGRWLEKGELIETAAPYPQKLGAWSFLYRAHKPGLAESLEDPRAWAPSLFDGDASL